MILVGKLHYMAMRAFLLTYYTRVWCRRLDLELSWPTRRHYCNCQSHFCIIYLMQFTWSSLGSPKACMEITSFFMFISLYSCSSCLIYLFICKDMKLFWSYAFLHGYCLLINPSSEHWSIQRATALSDGYTTEQILTELIVYYIFCVTFPECMNHTMTSDYHVPAIF